MKLVRKTFVCWLGVDEEATQISEGTAWCEIDFPEGVWGVEVFDVLCVHGDEGIVGKGSDKDDRRRYVFGVRYLETREIAERAGISIEHAVTERAVLRVDGTMELLQRGDVFISVAD